MFPPAESRFPAKSSFDPQARGTFIASLSSKYHRPNPPTMLPTAPIAFPAKSSFDPRECGILAAALASKSRLRKAVA